MIQWISKEQCNYTKPKTKPNRLKWEKLKSKTLTAAKTLLSTKQWYLNIPSHDIYFGLGKFKLEKKMATYKQ